MEEHKNSFFSSSALHHFFKPVALKQSKFPWGDTNTLTGSRQCQLLLQLQGLLSLNSSTWELTLPSPYFPAAAFWHSVNITIAFLLVNYQDKPKGHVWRANSAATGKKHQREKGKGKRFSLLGHKDKKSSIHWKWEHHFIFALFLFHFYFSFILPTYSVSLIQLLCRGTFLLAWFSSTKTNRFLQGLLDLRWNVT